MKLDGHLTHQPICAKGGAVDRPYASQSNYQMGRCSMRSLGVDGRSVLLLSLAIALSAK